MKLVLIIFIGALLTTSCVRFNTFYHAKQAYMAEEEKRLQQERRSGLPPLPGTEPKPQIGKKKTTSNNRRSTPQQRRNPRGRRGVSSQRQTDRNRSTSTGYKRVIEKCAKIITLYPNSKFADDAIILMGNAYLRQADYESALRKFDELEIYYPTSEFVPEAAFNKGYAYYLSEDYETAISNLTAFIDKYSKSEWTDDAYYYLANSYFALKDYRNAAENYGKLLYNFPKSEWALFSAYFRGKALFELEDYKNALVAFKQVLKLKPTKELRAEAEYDIGRCQLKLGNYELAYQLFYELLKRAEHSDNPKEKQFAAKAELKMVQSYRYIIGPQETIRKLNDVITKYGKSETAGEAQFEIGDIYQTDLDSIEKAKEAYDKVRQLSGRDSEIAKLSLERSTSIGQLMQFHNVLGAKDEQEVAKNLFLLAELYYFEMDKPDSAILQYNTIVKGYPQSDYAPKSLYSLAWIYEQEDNQTKANELYQQIINDYPLTTYANSAREKLGLEPITIKEKITDKTLLLKAEKFIDEDNPDSAKYYYEKLMREYPNSKLKPKAAFGIAWIYENQYKNSELALEHYKIVQDSFPQSEEARFLNRRFSKSEKPKAKTKEKKEEKTPPNIESKKEEAENSDEKPKLKKKIAEPTPDFDKNLQTHSDSEEDNH